MSPHVVAYTLRFVPAKWREGDPLGQRGFLTIAKQWSDGKESLVDESDTVARTWMELIQGEELSNLLGRCGLG